MAKYKLAESTDGMGLESITIDDLAGFPLERPLADLCRIMGSDTSAHMYFSKDRAKLYADGNGWFALYEKAQ